VDDVTFHITDTNAILVVIFHENPHEFHTSGISVKKQAKQGLVTNSTVLLRHFCKASNHEMSNHEMSNHEMMGFRSFLFLPVFNRTNMTQMCFAGESTTIESAILNITET